MARWLVLVPFLSAFHFLSCKSALPDRRLLSHFLLTSAQLDGSDVEYATDFKTGEVDIHIPDNMKPKWEKGPRILQASMMIGDQHLSVYESYMETHLVHGQKWGYPTHVLNHDLSGKTGWIRPKLRRSRHVLSLLKSEMAKPSHERADWIVWFDADTVILNVNIPWTLFLPPEDSFSDIHFIASGDDEEVDYGIFFLRVNEWSVNLLTQIATFPQSRPEVDRNLDEMWWVLDQPENQGHVMYQPWNWYSGVDLEDQGLSEIYEADIRIHVVGDVDSEGRKEAAVHRWLSKIRTSPQKSHAPLEASGYTEKVQMFWDVRRTAKELLQDSKERSYKLKRNFKEVKTAEEQLEHLTRLSVCNIEAMIMAVVTLRMAYDDAEKEIAGNQDSWMAAAIALSETDLTPWMIQIYRMRYE